MDKLVSSLFYLHKTFESFFNNFSTLLNLNFYIMNLKVNISNHHVKIFDNN